MYSLQVFQEFLFLLRLIIPMSSKINFNTNVVCLQPFI